MERFVAVKLIVGARCVLIVELSIELLVIIGAGS
jgi:hypothetical protein